MLDFPGIALACGYRHTYACDDAQAFESSVWAALNTNGPVLVHARIRPGSMAKLGRPTIPPHEVARRFKSFLAS